MTQRMFVCHAKSDIEATSEIVDALEGALELPTGTLVASSLPGYAADVRGEGDLHATLTGATLMLALFTERSTYDPEFVFELGAAWALGIDVLPLLLGATNESDVPWPLRDRPRLRAQDETAWNDLVQQLSHRLQVAVRAPEITPALTALPAPEVAPAFEPPPVKFSEPLAASASPSTKLPEPLAPPPPLAQQLFDSPPPPLAQQLFDSPPPPLAQQLFDLPPIVPPPPLENDLEPHAFEPPPALEPTGFPEPVRPVFDYAVVADSAEDPEPERNPPVSVISPVMSDVQSVSLPPPAAIPAEAFDSPSDVHSQLPSYRMSLEAGRALSDCVFNREESFDFIAELNEPFGRFVDAMGGSWAELRKFGDFDVWIGATENLLQNLPAQARRISAWYEVGYELAILHNLAGQGLFDSEERKAEAERLWRKALERFLIRAENAHIPYEDLARVLALLENLVAPQSERDLSSIARSLDELRRQAEGADEQHSAA